MESDSLLERYQRAWDDLLGEDLESLLELRHLLRVVPIAREVNTVDGALQFISIESYVEGCVLRYVLWLDQPLQPADGDPPTPESMIVFTDDLGTRYHGWPGSTWLEGGRSYEFWYRVPRPLDPKARRLRLEVREIWWTWMREPRDPDGEPETVIERLQPGPWVIEIDLA